MSRYYIVIEITTTLTDDVLDEDGVVTEVGTKNLARNTLLELGTVSSRFPNLITHLRSSLDGQKIIVELELPSLPTKAQVVDKLAELLPWTSQQISNNSAFTKFAGNNYEARRKTVVAYLIDNSAAWEGE